MLQLLKRLKAYLLLAEVSTRLVVGRVGFARPRDRTEKDSRMPRMDKQTADRINKAADRIQKNRSRRSDDARDRAYVWHSNAIEGDATTVSRRSGHPSRGN